MQISLVAATAAAVIGCATVSAQEPDRQHAEAASMPLLGRLMAQLGFEPRQADSLDFSFSYAYEPPDDNVVNPDFRKIDKAYDLWGRTITPEEARGMRPEQLSPANGAVKVDERLLRAGR